MEHNFWRKKRSLQILTPSNDAVNWKVSRIIIGRLFTTTFLEHAIKKQAMQQVQSMYSKA